MPRAKARCFWNILLLLHDILYLRLEKFNQSKTRLCPMQCSCHFPGFTLRYFFFLSIWIPIAGYKIPVTFFIRNAARTMINVVRKAVTIVRTARTFKAFALGERFPSPQMPTPSIRFPRSFQPSGRGDRRHWAFLNRVSQSSLRGI